MRNNIKLNCPTCGFEDTHREIIKRKSVPILQNTTIRDKEAALRFPSGELLFLQCKECSFLWNSSFDNNLICYDETYNNDVSSSGYYCAHLEARVKAILSAVPDNEPIHYLEIGCGDGEFLHLLLELSNGRVKSATGFDPSYSNDRTLPDNVVIHREYFSRDNYSKVREGINVICSRHVIEHIADVSSFAEVLSGFVTHKNQHVFIETPTVDWIFENTAFFDFFYEHCSLFNPHSIQQLFGRYGLGGDVKLVYNKQYLWAELKFRGAMISRMPDADLSLRLGKAYLGRAEELIKRWKDRLCSRKNDQRIGIWGAASKGVTFALIMKQIGQEIDFAIDLNVDKQGCFTPVTGIKIEAPSSARLSEKDTIIVMNPNYFDEIKKIMKTNNIVASLEKI